MQGGGDPLASLSPTPSFSGGRVQLSALKRGVLVWERPSPPTRARQGREWKRDHLHADFYPIRLSARFVATCADLHGHSCVQTMKDGRKETQAPFFPLACKSQRRGRMAGRKEEEEE